MKGEGQFRTVSITGRLFGSLFANGMGMGVGPEMPMSIRIMGGRNRGYGLSDRLSTLLLAIAPEHFRARNHSSDGRLLVSFQVMYGA